MLKFEKYLREFTNSIDFAEFALNLVIASVLALLLKYFYIYFTNALSNKRRFADNFLLLTLTTAIIITIVKSSIALSLGLVGALSIVRFRSAIKSPEELTFLFFSIAIGLAIGANQPLIAVFSTGFVLTVLYLNRLSNGKAKLKSENKMYLNIKTDVQDLNAITNSISPHCNFLELKKMDKKSDTLILSFLFSAAKIEAIENLKNSLSQLSVQTEFSIVAEPSLVA